MDFKFPDVGEGITEGRLVKWHINVGDSIKNEQTVASIETDKAVVDIPSPVGGVVESLAYKEGDTVFVGKTLMVINDTGKPSPAQQPISAQSIAPKVEIEARMPERIMDSVPSPRFEQYSVSNPASNNYNNQNSSSSASNGLILAMPAVRKAARLKGIDLSKIRGKGNHGQILLSDINVDASEMLGAPKPQSIEIKYSDVPALKHTPLVSNVNSSFNGKSYADILATPSTKMLARELGIDLTLVHGTGANGAITRDDVLASGKKTSEPPAQLATPFQPSAAVENKINSQVQSMQSSAVPKQISVSGEATIVPFTPTRNAIYKHMIESKNNIPHFTITDEVDITELYNFREKYKEHYEKQGVKLTYLPFIAKAVIDSLIKHPYLNSTVNDAGKETILKKYYNIGIATDTPDGLTVPVVKNADKKSITAIAQEIALLSAKARDHKLSLDDMSDGTFTITSLGNSFGQSFTPIINYPQTAILGVGRIVEKPAIINGAIVARKIVTLSLSADHRIIDGAEASRFMNDVKWNIENFQAMLLN